MECFNSDPPHKETVSRSCWWTCVF